MINYSQLAKAYNSADLMKTIAALQLLPRNHGKNYRLEQLARIAAGNHNTNDELVPIDELKKILLDEYPQSEQEDHPVNLFTENAIFSGGNYIVFPGIFEGGASLLNNLFFSTFFWEASKIPDPFIKKTKPAVLLILRLSNCIAEQVGLKRGVYEKPIDKTIEFPELSQLQNLKEAVTFSKPRLLNCCKEWRLDPEIIDDFITDFKDPDLENEASLSPLRKRPFVLIEDKYILLQPTCVVEALIDFIWEEAQRQECYDAVWKSLLGWEWSELGQLCFHMQWRPIEIELSALPIDSSFRETFYAFDLNKVVHVCFVETGKTYTREETDYSIIDNPPADILALSELMQARQIEVRSHFDKQFINGSFEILTLYVVSEVGFPQLLSFPNPSSKYPMLWFRLTELKRIVHLEDPDPLLLWKFAKNYAEVFEQCEIACLGGLLDVYVYYRTNAYTLWPSDKERPGIIGILPGYSSVYSRHSLLKRDEHLAPFIFENSLAHVPVYNYCEYAPFYMHTSHSVPAPILLEDFIMPVWIFNDQIETHPAQPVNMQMEMIAFWIRKLKPYVERYFEGVDTGFPLRINVIMDDRFINEIRPNEVRQISLDEIELQIEGSYPEITLTIPLELTHWYTMPHNEGERYVMLKLLHALVAHGSGIPSLGDLQVIIDKAIPFGRAKMFTMLGANTFILENRFLPPYRAIQQYDITFIKYNLLRLCDLKASENDFLSLKAKKDLCNRISKSLREHIILKLKSYDQQELLLMLLSLHEACVQKRAIQELDMPGRKAILGSEHTQIVSLMQAEQLRVKTALALRCSIELIVAYDPIFGNRKPNFDEIDELVAMMFEMISWGMLSDGMHLGLYNPDMFLSPSGNIEVDYEEINSAFVPFTASRTENEAFHFEKNYDDLFEFAPFDENEKKSTEVLEIENAFKKDFGLSFLRLHDLVCDLVNLVRRANASVICIEEGDLKNELKKTKHLWTDSEITSALKLLTLESGWDIDNPPPEYRKQDTYPWHYRRALSFIRKPIARLTRNNKSYYYWSYRHLFASIDNTLNMLYEGTLSFPGANAVNAMVTTVRDRKGKFFRNQVVSWLKENSLLEIIPYEVSMKPNGKIDTHENLGDIDILAIDHEAKIIYCIECKNSVDSRAPFEMKIEIDKYVGQNEGEGWIQKHVRRYEWLKTHRSSLDLLVANISEYKLKAPLLTYEEIPLPYIKKDLPLTIVSFSRLKIMGVDQLRICK